MGEVRIDKGFFPPYNGDDNSAGEEGQSMSMYQISRITDKEGVTKADPDSREWTGSVGEAKMEEKCVLIHCRYDRRGEPCDRYIRTSYVQSWKKDPDTGRIVVETMNSMYYLDPVKK